MIINSKGILDSGTVYLRQLGNDWPTAQVYYTSDIIESTSLYFTNTRVLQAVEPKLTTANVTEVINQYFTNTRVAIAVVPQLTTGNVIELSSNLYFTNTRAISALYDANVIVANITSRGDVVAYGNLIANGLIIRNISVSDTVLSGATSANTVVAESITANIWNRLYTANVVESPTNLYFTNSRVRTAFVAGKGIAITSDGVIKNTGSAAQYNLDINGTTGGNVLSTMSTMLTFPTVPATDRYLLRSLHVVNTSGGTAQISGNILYATGNTAPIANLIPVAQGGVLEFIKTYQLFQPGDKINLQGFNAAGTATANLMTAMLTYETFAADQSFIGTGKTIANVDTNTQIYDSSQSYSVIESIKFINLQSIPVPVRCYWGDANGAPRAYLSYGLPIPPNSSVELLQAAKRINLNDKLYASYSGAPNAAVSVFVSARIGAAYSTDVYTASAIPGNTVVAAFSTTDNEGAVLYYTIE